jgi:beta-galactosidase
MHYWRVDPSSWARCLSTISSSGLTIVETYVPWRVHERSPGQYDWSGKRDLVRFLDLAHEANLHVIVRPGPNINAELTGFGIPDRILSDPSMQSRTAAGTPVWLPSPPRAFPIPSYASPAFLDEVRRWYAAVADVIRPFLAGSPQPQPPPPPSPSSGPIVAIGIDNEALMFFRTAAFDHDYAGRDDAPKRFDPTNPSTAIEWIRGKDDAIATALATFGSMLDDLDLDVARFHNLPPVEPFSYDLPRIEKAIGGPVGIDVYAPRTHFPAIRRRALHAVGSSALPIAPEVGVGFLPWLPPLDDGRDPDRDRDQLLSLLACGIRGFSLFMAVERDRFYGAAIDARGTLEARWIAPLCRALDEIDWPSLRRSTPIALVASRADARFGTATSTIDPITPLFADFLPLGPGGAAELGTDRDAIDHRRWFAAIERALALAHADYAIVDEGADFSGYAAIIVPTLSRIDRAVLEKLRALSNTTIVIGPGTPSRDELDRPLAIPLPKRLGRIRPGSLDDLPGLADDLAALSPPRDHWTITRPDLVTAWPHHDPSHRVRCVFVTSDADRPVTASLTTEPSRSLRDPFDAPIPIENNEARIRLPPRGVRMLLVD